jgi:uncharacterized protein YdeI (YjbR/CyaY-like superfamily)
MSRSKAPTRSFSATSTGGSSTLGPKKTSTKKISGETQRRPGPALWTRQLPEFQAGSRKAWRAWLQKHHATSSGVWLVIAKKHTGIPSLTYGEAVEEALCFGWIDSLMHPIDDTLYRQVFTPRKPKSVWSAPNRARVEKMIAARLMTAAGMAMITLAKKSGTWDALKQIEQLEAPADLKQALNANAAAKKNWPRFTPGGRKMLLYWLNDAKRPETRSKRIASIVDLLARNISLSDLRTGKVKLS